MNIDEIKKDELIYADGNYNRDMLYRINIEDRRISNEERERLYNKKYLGEIIDEEQPKFSSNNLILAPVGSGKSYLIEKMLIPNDYDKKIIYLVSNTSLKDSLSPNNNEIRKLLADNGQSIKFFTSENKTAYGDRAYNVHVMTYHEFGMRIEAPYGSFLNDVELIFCDEIHSLPLFKRYSSNNDLGIATRWLFTKHKDIDIYYFTATEDSILSLEDRSPGHLTKVKQFNYLNHPNIRRYEAKSIYYITHIEQIRVHLRARLESFNRNGYKGMVFSKFIKKEEEIKTIAEEEGYIPLVLWSVNNEEAMSEEQLKMREYILNTGNIPEPYNILIINGAMQEGWNLYDDKVTFAILDTLDNTEQIQALGRIRKDIDFVVYKTDDESLTLDYIVIDEGYMNIPLTPKEKDELSEVLKLPNKSGSVAEWRELKPMLKKAGYTLDDRTLTIDGARLRTTTITK